MKVSLIISVYKNVADLHTVLEGLRFQSYKDFEIVISEDGAFDGMKSFIQQYAHPNPILHLTQPDVGWRKNQALNNAIRKCSGDYLIFIDGDCVLHHKFIENHLRYAQPGRIIAGKRIKLGERYSGLFRSNIENLLSLERQVQREGREVRKDGGKFYEEAFYIDPDSWLGIIPKLRGMYQLKGCNMSFHREAIEKINGFDEDYILPAIGEDIDLTWRFQEAGYTLFSVRNLAVQYHLYHRENWTDQSENQRLMEAKQAQKKFICDNGLYKRNGVAQSNAAVSHIPVPNSSSQNVSAGKVLLIEFKYHQEIIPSQLLMLLEGGHEVHLIMEKKLWDEQLLGTFRSRVSMALIPHTQLIIQKIAMLFRIRRYVREHGIEHLVFNTLDSNFNYFLLLLNPGVHAVGIVHQIHRFIKKRIHRKSLELVSGIATLSTYTLRYFQDHFEHYRQKSICFYPIYFDTDRNLSANVPDTDIRIVIPGQLDLKKRDYFQLLAALEKGPNLKSVKFFLLGNIQHNDGPAILQSIKAKGLGNLFYWRDEFIPYNEFFDILRSSDYVMPLLSRGIDNQDHYRQSQISASFNWAYAFQKKMLIHEAFRSIAETNNAIFYSDEDFIQTLQSLEKRPGAYHIPHHFEFKIQQRAYLSLFQRR